MIDINELRFTAAKSTRDLALLPSEVNELLDRLEAAENDTAHQKALAESALRVAEGWERKCGELRTKIEAMERQEPVYLFRRKGLDEFCTCSKERYDELGQKKMFEVKKLYALPGAKGE